MPFKTGVVQVTATATATSVRDLIDTALGSKVDYSKFPFINHIEINPEALIRYTLDRGTITTTTGMKAIADSYYVFEGSTLDDVLLIAASGTVKVNIQVGQTEKQP